MSKAALRKTSQEDQNMPKWVSDMHAHFDSTGYYRPQDLRRVLGDQRETVAAATNKDPFANFLSNKK